MNLDEKEDIFEALENSLYEFLQRFTCYNLTPERLEEIKLAISEWEKGPMLEIFEDFKARWEKEDKEMRELLSSKENQVCH